MPNGIRRFQFHPMSNPEVYNMPIRTGLPAELLHTVKSDYSWRWALFRLTPRTSHALQLNL